MTLNMTPGEQIDVIWVIKINLDSTTIYLSDTDDKITLSGIDFDGKVIMHRSISDIDKTISMTGGGGLGNIGAFSFGIARYNNHVDTQDFFDDFFPSNSNYVSGRVVEIGIIWEGATLLSQITWLPPYYVEDYSYNENTIMLTCYELDEIFHKQILSYEIQKDFNNGISYFENAPVENYGVPLPIVYGDFQTLYDYPRNNLTTCPLVCVDRHTLQYIISSHKILSFHSSFYNPGVQGAYWRYLGGIKVYMRCYTTNAIASNTFRGSNITLFQDLDNTDNALLGALTVQTSLLGTQNTYIGTDIGNVSDIDPATSITLDVADTFSMKVEGSEGNLGTAPNNVNTSIFWEIQIANEDVGITSYDMGYYNKQYNSGAGGTFTDSIASGGSTKRVFFATEFSARDTSDEMWRFDELFNLEFFVKPVGSGTVDVTNTVLTVIGLLILDTRKLVTETIIVDRDDVRSDKELQSVGMIY